MEYKLLGAQNERSRMNFRIGIGKGTIPEGIIHAFSILKKASAMANAELLQKII